MSNLRNAGRQSLIITLNFNRVDDKVNEILNLCSNENTKEKIISFCNDVMSEYCQTVKKCDQQSQITFQFDRSIQALVVHNFLSRPI